MLLSFFCVAMASDRSELQELQDQVASYDVSLVSAEELLADPSNGEGRAERSAKLADTLEAEAVGLRPVMRELHILEGRIKNAGHAENLKVLEALRTTISEQRARRTFLADALAAGVALDATTDDPSQWRLAEMKFVGAARRWRGAPPDAWVLPFLEKAAAAERWGSMQGGAEWCSLVCTDRAAGLAILKKLPETYRKDARWLKPIAEAKKNVQP